MKPRDRAILGEFTRRVHELESGARVWAFGSRARGNPDPESDFDLCVVVSRPSEALTRAIRDAAWELSLEHECVLTTLIIAEHDFEEGPISASSLVRTFDEKAWQLDRVPKVQELVRYRMEQAEEALAAAQTNLAHGQLRSAINRLYYSMFYAVLALLATSAAETSRHSGAISRFDRDYIKTGLLPKDFSRWLHDAFAQRQSADYGAAYVIESVAVDALSQNARTFVTGVSEHLRSTGFPGKGSSR